MKSCLLCLESIIGSEAIEITENIKQNFTVRDAIVEYFKCSKAILESQLRFICSTCYNNLEHFHNFAIKVNNIYKSDLTLNSGSDARLDVKENIDDSNESFIDDLIEYDEGEIIEFESNDGLSERSDKIYSKDQIEDLSSERTQNDCDSVRNQSNINVLPTLSPASNVKTLQSSPVRVILPKNFIKISQSSIDLLKLQNVKDTHSLEDNIQLEGNNEEMSPDLILLCDTKSRSSYKVQQGDDPVNHTELASYSEDPSPNTRTVSKNQNSIQKSQNFSKTPVNTKRAPPKIHKCEICIKIFKTSAILKSHIQKIHSDTQEPSICKECGKVYTNKYILKTHMRKHIIDPDKKYECYICKKPSKNLPHLLDHFKYKHDPAYSSSSVCHICSKTVTRLDIHLRQMHPSDPIERVKCEICGHFMKKSSLKGHLASHSEAGFSCEACGKYLKNKNSLLCHMKRVHTTGKYKCEHCDKSYHQEGQLMDHIACQHTGVFLHKCRIADCDKKFRNAGRRRMHERRMHPVDYEKSLKAPYLRENLAIQ